MSFPFNLGCPLGDLTCQLFFLLLGKFVTLVSEVWGVLGHRIFRKRWRLIGQIQLHTG